MSRAENWFVIGSGPAGLAAARALLAAGRAVTMLDVGLTLEPEREAIRAGMAGKPAADWAPAARALVAPRLGAGVPEKLNFGSDYPYRGAAGMAGGLRGSFAQGGLSNVWGSAMLPYAQADLAGWPVSAAELAPHYRAVLDFVPMAAVEDGLAADWPLHGTPGAPLPDGAQIKIFRAALDANRAKLGAEGLRFGGARLAVRAQDCILCGACLQGCPKNLIFSAARALDGIDYLPGMRVTRIAEAGDGVRIFAREANGAERVFEGARVFVAAGVLHSTEIMLRSLGRGRAEILDSQYFLLPLLQLKAAPDVRREHLHSMASLFLELNDPAISRFGVHLQIYGYNDILAAALDQKFGWLARFLPTGLLLNRMLIVQGYLHSAQSGRIAVRLEGDRLEVTATPSGEALAAVKRVIGKLQGLAPALRAMPLTPLLQMALPGRGFHSGGSFPMAEHPGPGQTDTLGRPQGMDRVHMVDAAVFPSIPATTITLSAMANAHRIASAAAGLA